VAGDSKEAKRQAADVIGRVRGLRPVDCGSLESARFIEALTPLLIAVNIRHKAHAGVKITGLPEALW
jgi:predicted dinucleotide-binding enzyme